jgi:hypothetical protein
MDIRIVETLPTSGILADPFYKLDGTKESVTLDWSYVNNSFDLIDRNIDYSRLPVRLAAFNSNGNVTTPGLVKKTFLTYNGISTETGEILETVVAESANTADPNNLPGYINSNEWLYQPANFRVPAELQSSSSNDLLVWPYPFNEGVTLIKTFLNSQSNTVQPLYTAYYRRPTLTSFQLANVEGAKVFTDGWYSSYVIAVKTYSLINPIPTNPLTCSNGLILYNDTDKKFYVNITGACLPVNLTTLSHLPNNDIVNWKASPSFQDWVTFLKNNYHNTFAAGGQNQNNNFNGTLSPNITSGYTTTLNTNSSTFINTSTARRPGGIVEETITSPIIPVDSSLNNTDTSPSNIVTANDNVFYVECNHLATPELNAAIILELKKLCGCCHTDKFNMSHIENWIKLTGKRASAFIYFNEENYKEAESILISARPHCSIDLYNQDNCNFKYNSKCY